MNKKWNKKILVAFMEWDYGDASRGASIEKSCFYTALGELVESVEAFWIEAYLANKSQLQDLLIKKAVETSPDLIMFIPSRDEFLFETLDYLKNRYATYAWFGDDQWRFEKYSSLLAPHFTHVSTTDMYSVDRYRQLGINPILTQWAGKIFSKGTSLKNGIEKYTNEVSFVGGASAYRRWVINELCRKGIPVSCYGAGWEHGRVSFEEMEEIFKTSKINLNISNSVEPNVKFLFNDLRNFISYLRTTKHAEQIKARNFEIPLAGGFQLSNYVLGLERYLDIGKELAVYTSVDECAQQIHYYLHHDVERRAIADAGQQRSRDEHTYLQRLSNILTVIWGRK